MPSFLKNVSLDGIAVQFQMDSPVLLFFDPTLWDGLCDLLSPGIPVDVAGVFDRANADFPAMACHAISNFRPGGVTLDPGDIRKFGYEDEGLDFSEEAQMHAEPDNEALSFPWAAVDSGALVLVDATHLVDLVHALSWQQYCLGLDDQAIFCRIAGVLGGDYFAIALGACVPDMEFDGDGTYTLPVGCVRPKVD